jgi:hypothetical protein
MLIIDYARRRQAQKRGGEFEITAIATDIADAVADVDELSHLNDGLTELEQTDPRLALAARFLCPRGPRPSPPALGPLP